MKREGRQHGMVRTYMILPSPSNSRPVSRYPNRPESPPTAGLFTKVSSKPTNHSKYTGKCGKPKCSCCHLNPSSKSKDKSKGAHKMKLISFGVLDDRSGFSYSGSSASGILDHINNGYDHDCDYDYDEEEDGVNEVYDELCDVRGIEDDHENGLKSEDDVDVSHDDQDDDCMSFCEVGLTWDQLDGDESWCLVGEM